MSNKGSYIFTLEQRLQDESDNLFSSPAKIVTGVITHQQVGELCSDAFWWGVLEVFFK